MSTLTVIFGSQLDIAGSDLGLHGVYIRSLLVLHTFATGHRAWTPWNPLCHCTVFKKKYINDSMNLIF